jgi:broad specificity phosphatase PhoE
VNFNPLAEIPNWRDRTDDPFPAEREAIRERARYVRRWLRGRPERCIVLVTHGNFLQTIVHGQYIGKEVEFANAEVRRYTFAEPVDQDEDAWLVLQEEEVTVGEKLATSEE